MLPSDFFNSLSKADLRIAEGSGALAAAKALSNPLAVTTNLR